MGLWQTCTYRRFLNVNIHFIQGQFEHHELARYAYVMALEPFRN
jgi:hypothetical protein